MIPDKFKRLDETNVWCVYCLMRGDEVIYVGSTGQLRNRIRTHRRKVIFDFVVYRKFQDRYLMLDFEAKLIHELKPEFNRFFPIQNRLKRSA